mmetsp:Transcript_11680/g.25444  ORF Transcript_11680/g.25444 Transcript_11680/m.25444 type:complete len:120 (-) Transcript_11680:897-1256(-)
MLHEGIRGGWPRNEGSVGGILGQIVGSGPRSELDPELDPSDGTAQDTPGIQEERSSGVTHGMAGHDLLSGHALRQHVDELLRSMESSDAEVLKQDGQKADDAEIRTNVGPLLPTRAPRH